MWHDLHGLKLNAHRNGATPKPICHSNLKLYTKTDETLISRNSAHEEGKIEVKGNPQ